MNDRMQNSRYRLYTGLLSVTFSLLFVNSAHAQIPLCGDVFTNGVQAHRGFSEADPKFVDFGFNARITSPSSAELNVRDVSYNPWSLRKSCSTEHCQASGDLVPWLWVENFPETGSALKYLVPRNTRLTVGNDSSDIGELDIREYATAEFSTQHDSYVVDRLFVGYKATVRLPAGNYWVRDFRMELESRLEVIGEGSVNLFVQNSLDISHKVLINNNTKDPSKLAIYDQSSSHFHVGSTTYAFIVTENEFILSHAAKIYGGIIGQFIYLESESEVIFDAGAAKDISISGLCQSGSSN